MSFPSARQQVKDHTVVVILLLLWSAWSPENSYSRLLGMEPATVSPSVSPTPPQSPSPAPMEKVPLHECRITFKRPFQTHDDDFLRQMYTTYQGFYVVLTVDERVRCEALRTQVCTSISGHGLTCNQPGWRHGDVKRKTATLAGSICIEGAHKTVRLFRSSRTRTIPATDVTNWLFQKLKAFMEKKATVYPESARQFMDPSFEIPCVSGVTLSDAEITWIVIGCLIGVAILSCVACAVAGHLEEVRERSQNTRAQSPTRV